MGNLPTVPPAPSRTAGETSGDAVPAGPDVIRPRHVTPTRIDALAARIAEATGSAPEIHGDPTVAVTGACLRAQDIVAGELFAALPGANVHGADFAAVALECGAAAVLTDPDGVTRPAIARAGVPVLVHPQAREALGPASSLIFGDPTRRLAVLGVTGTSGKTTTSYLLEAALAAAGATTGLIGTVETRMRGRHVPSAFTTPEAPDLQALFAAMVEEGITHTAMEVSSHALSQARVGGTTFAVGAFTNLSAEHLDYHHTMEGYFEAKALLFDGRASAHVVCVDDTWGHRLATRADAVTVSATGQPADWTATGVHAHRDGTQTFHAQGPDGLDLPVTLRLPGAFNVANALVALACGAAAGLDPARLAAGFAQVQVPGRMQRVDVGQPFLAVVDYAHKPAAVEALLTTLRAQGTGRVLTVLGCGGDRDREKRPVMGALAAELSDLVWITDDNPRTEDPAAIRAAMLDGARTSDAARAKVTEQGDRRTAIRAAIAAARPGDVVVVAGKGHEPGQKVGAEVLPFSDVDEVHAALRSTMTDQSIPEDPA
ncbi:UDP-N-acetylmuramoyl-L-alanyl-D-glutamate--2,6-diaminopimelate ligase [Actinomycetospora endophytica]|uniref:UDP-N-acetylmuramoyl-L-alanyl-D-glutamate--2,6-diaminopimelate ligase n=1 Tax=Actinomycetospora endophytica TaxID=2291215 RepID=A0ABS8PHK7_9PSEU|nr:UDP-N-acetylmuramoyl-L-alanyl-D-glutamate--2,6-diaminopimelate ligase [Actinomycetospora endophytica]MCD2196464.1 UDP-N-acetylmuramoyl-L-alanyl-D-glutamate--2,6-diaminopimelate ligase [Actinomycetospora endophytica]